MTEYVTRIKSGIKIYVRAWPTILTRSDVALRGKNHKKVKRRKKERKKEIAIYFTFVVACYYLIVLNMCLSVILRKHAASKQKVFKKINETILLFVKKVF